MSLIYSIFNNSSHIEFPRGIISWLIWFLYFSGTIYLVWKGLKFHPKKPRIPFIWSGILVIGAVITAGFLGISFSFGLDLPLPGLPMQANGAAWMIFSAIPWMLAAFTFGPVPSVVLAFISGFIISIWHDYSFFTPVIFALLAAVFSQLVNTNYRSSAYGWLHKPYGAAFVIAAIFPLLRFFSDILLFNVSVVERIDFSFAYLFEHSLAYGLAVMLAGVLIGLILKRWDHLSIIRPNDGSKSMNMTLAGRMLMLWIPMMLILLFSLVASTWFFGSRSSFKRVADQMFKTGDVISAQVPGFVHMGQNLISSAVKSEVLKNSNDFQEMNSILERQIADLSFFDQFFVLDIDGNPITGYPQQDFDAVLHSAQELEGIGLVSSGMGFQFYTIPSGRGSIAQDFAFIKPISNSEGQVVRILVGRTETVQNLYADPFINELAIYERLGGQAFILNNTGEAVYSSDPNSLGFVYPLETIKFGEVLNGIGTDGTHELKFSSKIEGSPFTLALTIPTAVPLQDVIQQISVIFFVLIATAVLGFLTLWVNMRMANKQIEEKKILQRSVESHPEAGLRLGLSTPKKMVSLRS